MLPVLRIGGWSAPTYAVVYALAVLVAGSLAWRQLGRLGADAPRWRAGLPFVVLALLLGLFLPAWVESHVRGWLTGQPPQPATIRVYYALGSALLAVLIYVRLRRLDPLAGLDTLLPVFALAYSLGRLGCLAAGCCGGRETDSFLHLHLPDEQGAWADRYPTQPMSGAWQLLLFLWLARPRAWPAWLNVRGARTAAYLLLFCAERFTLEFLRADYQPLVGPFSLPHLWMLALAGVGVGLGLAAAWNSGRRGGPPHHARLAHPPHPPACGGQRQAPHPPLDRCA